MSWFTRWFGRRSRPAGTTWQKARLQVEALEAREVPTVMFYGGNVLPHVEAQAVYYGSGWTGSSLTTTIDASLKDLTGGAYMDALTRAGYGVGRGTTTAGKLDNVALSSTITDASIQARLLADIKSGLLAGPDANRLYVVYVQPNVAVNLGGGQGTTQQGILGYHGAFAGPSGSTIRYAVVAYPGGTVHNSSLGTSAIDQLTDVASHEVAEAVTDPDVNYRQLGWYDPKLGEIGDVTENNPNANVRLDGYLVQEVADKNDNLLSIFVSSQPPSTPPPSTTVSTTTTLSAGPVHYSWFSPPTVQLTMIVTPGSGTTPPDGTVDLLYNGAVLGSGTIRVVNGVAEVTFNVQFFGSGKYTFSAQYRGSTHFHSSTSNSVTVSV